MILLGNRGGYFAMNTPFKEPFILAFVRAIRKPLALEKGGGSTF